MATEDNKPEATQDNKPKKTGLGWVPKLSLLAVIAAFGYLYLSTRDRDVTTDTIQTAAAVEETRAEGGAGGFQDEVLGKLSELSSKTGILVSDATEAGSEVVKSVIEKVKSLKGEPSPADESASAAATTADTTVVEASPAIEPAVAVQAPVAAMATAAAPSIERPAPSGFARHSAPLPAAAPARAPGEQAAVPDQSPEPALPVADAEVSVFAESVMEGSTAPAATAPAVSAPKAPMAAAGEPAAIPLPVVPQPFAGVDPMVAPGLSPEDGRRDFEQRQAAMAQYAAEYRARMMAEHEQMRRLADQNARAYWERMQQAAPAAAGPMGYPSYGPAYTPPFGPGYGPAYGGPPVYPR
jgi:hypothetical protein